MTTSSFTLSSSSSSTILGNWEVVDGHLMGRAGGERIITSRVVAVSADGLTARTASGRVYRLFFARGEQAACPRARIVGTRAHVEMVRGHAVQVWRDL